MTDENEGWHTTMTAELIAKLRIIRTQGVGPVTFKKALRHFGDAEAACAGWHSHSRKMPTLCDTATVQRELETLAAAGGILLMLGDENYPPQLAQLPDAPIALSVLGDFTHLHARQVAIVGNRNASAAGISWGRQLAADLARAGIVTTSGLARGIDTAAHEGALASGGATVAVVAGGVDHIYPPENAKLREAIMAQGCVVSEQPWGATPTASLFPRRNRIIAGLSIGVVVSEATRHSGSLITAECALNYGRDVWAVPGSPGDPRSGGPNWLLKNGATLIENAADILHDLPQKPAPFVPRALAQPTLFSTTATDDAMTADDEEALTDAHTPQQRVFALLSQVSTSFDDLVRQAGLTESDLNSLLVEMELDGHAVREIDGRWRRA
jgi:DNA processing protein